MDLRCRPPPPPVGRPLCGSFGDGDGMATAMATEKRATNDGRERDGRSQSLPGCGGPTSPTPLVGLNFGTAILFVSLSQPSPPTPLGNAESRTAALICPAWPLLALGARGPSPRPPSSGPSASGSATSRTLSTLTPVRGPLRGGSRSCAPCATRLPIRARARCAAGRPRSSTSSSGLPSAALLRWGSRRLRDANLPARINACASRRSRNGRWPAIVIEGANFRMRASHHGNGSSPS